MENVISELSYPNSALSESCYLSGRSLFKRTFESGVSGEDFTKEDLLGQFSAPLPGCLDC